MMDIDGESVPEAIIIESIQAESKQEMKKNEMDELERVQSTVKLRAKIMSFDATQRQVKMEATIVAKDMDPVEKKALEETMLQFVIEASLREQKMTLLK